MGKNRKRKRNKCNFKRNDTKKMKEIKLKKSEAYAREATTKFLLVTKLNQASIIVRKCSIVSISERNVMAACGTDSFLQNSDPIPRFHISLQN